MNLPSKISELRSIYEKEGALKAISEIYGFFYRRSIKRIQKGIFKSSQATDRGNYLAAIGLFFEELFDLNIYMYVLKKYNESYILRPIHGFQMLLDPNDPGLSTELLSYGTREPLSSDIFHNQLKSLTSQNNKTTVILDIGANIGYYTLLEASTLRKNFEIHAFEPSPHNVSLLHKNTNINGYQDNIKINQVAVSENSGTSEMEITKKSNRNRMKDSEINKTGNDDLVTETIEVPRISIDDYLAENDIDPSDIDVIRMDVQGYEYNVLAGMESVLQSDSNKLMFIETHPSFINKKKQQVVVDYLDKGRFQPIFAANNFKTVSIEELDDMIGTSAEVMLKSKG